MKMGFASMAANDQLLGVELACLRNHGKFLVNLCIICYSRIQLRDLFLLFYISKCLFIS